MSQIYSKSSFDRFGDDLSEDVLSYLSLEDKIRLECMSRQTRRTVYRRQYDLTIDFDKNIFNRLKGSDVLENRFIDLKAFESVLKKCGFISNIDINYCKFFEDQNTFEKIIALVIDNCHKLTQIQYDFSQNLWSTIEKFFKKFGPNLKALELFDKQLIANKNLIFDSCLNLKSIKIFNLKEIFSDDMVLMVENLKNIEFNYTNDDIKRFEVFVLQTKNSLEAIDVRVSSGCDDNAIKVLFRQLTEAYNLKKVKLNFSPELEIPIGYPLIVDQIKQIGIKCFKLKSFRLNLTSDSNLINSEIFQSMKYFRQLKRLELIFNPKTNTTEAETKPSVKCKSLRECQHLTHLSLNGLEVDDKFFRYVDINLRRLQSLTISEANISGVAFCLLSELTQLKTIAINSNKCKPIDETIVYYLVGKSPKIQTIKYFHRGHKPIDLDEKKIFDVKQALKLGDRFKLIYAK